MPITAIPTHTAHALSALVLCATAALVGCGGSRQDAGPPPAAATVNKDEVSVPLVNLVLQQQRGLKPEQMEAASRLVLERLIDQELAVQKARELNLDRDPRVQLQVDAARRDIVSRAYAQKLGENAAKPTPDEVKKYYDEHPNLFSARRVYQLQEVLIAARPEQLPALQEQLKAAKTFGEFIEALKAGQFKFRVVQGVRGAEQLPLAQLATFAAMKDGDTIFSAIPDGARVVALVASRSQPVELDNARPIIETVLLNERKRRIVADDLKALRSAAKIQYAGKFAQAAPTPASAAAAEPAPVSVLEAPDPAASASLDGTALGKDPVPK